MSNSVFFILFQSTGDVYSYEMPDTRPRYRSESADILRERETQKRRDEFRTLTQVCHFISSKVRIQAFKVRIQALEVRIQALKVRIQAFKIRIQAFKIRIQAFKIRIQAFQIQIQAFKIPCREKLEACFTFP